MSNSESIGWSNVETYTKSGQSHPEFSQISPEEQSYRNQRSLSPESSPTLVVVKKKRKKNKKPATHIINKAPYHHEKRTISQKVEMDEE